MSMNQAEKEEVQQILDQALGEATRVPPAYNESDPLQDVTPLNFDFCQVAVSRDLFTPPPFVASKRLMDTNSRAIRFGASNNMITLLEGTPEEQHDYLVGLVTTSLLVALFMALWTIVIILFKFTGYRRCGFLCGRFIRPTKESKQVGDSLLYNKDANSPKSNHNSSRPSQHDLQNRASQQHPDVSQHRDDESLFNDEGDDRGRLADDRATLGEKAEPVATDLYFKKPSAQQEEEDEQEKQEQTEENKNEENERDTTENERAQEEDEKWADSCRRQQRRYFRVQVTVVLACLSIIVSGILFCVNGTKYVGRTLDTVDEGLRQLQDLTHNAMELIDSFIIVENTTQSELGGALPVLNTMCPNVQTEICTTLDPIVDNCNFTGIPVVNETLATIFELVYRTKSYVNNELTGMQDDLQDMNKHIEDALNTSLSLAWLFWSAFSFVVALTVCCLIIIVGIFCGRKYGKLNRGQRCFRHQVVIPLFCILTFLSFIFAITFILIAIGASDWCIESPDAKVSYLLNEVFEEDNPDFLQSVILDLAQYYVNSCPTELMPIQPSDQSAALRAILEVVQEFSQSLSGFPQEDWNQVCGKDFEVLETFKALIQGVVCLLTNSMEDIQRFFWCRQWSPIYITFMHEAVCNEAQTGLSWVASSNFVIVVCAFVVLLLRAGAFDIQDEEEFKRELRGCLDCCIKVVTCSCCGNKNHQPQGDDDKNNNNNIYLQEDMRGEERANSVTGGMNKQNGIPEQQQYQQQEQQSHQSAVDLS